ncbi:hypothetical protein YN1551_3250 [Sulfolobus islandicus Y.N.15.51]|uniref:Uncharacterized protein n=1 Tax=Saccharolobus islandicus (strain Y.N.15.51 / Yellowstone \|nr:hypothetical protein YN1551_3250 [Sulfolobus islandicus Y.N.15.51]
MRRSAYPVAPRFKSPLKGIKIADKGFSPSPTQLIAMERGYWV